MEDYGTFTHELIQFLPDGQLGVQAQAQAVHLTAAPVEQTHTMRDERRNRNRH